MRVGYGSYVEPASAATVEVPHVPEGRVLAPPRDPRKTTALTDNQRCAMPDTVLVDGVIPQQRAAHEL